MAGTEVTTQMSDVILVDDDLDSIGTVIKTGKYLRDARAQLLESCFRTSIVLTILTTISVITSPTAEAALSPVQMLWIMLLLNPFTALSLAVPQSTEASHAVLDAKPWLPSFPWAVFTLVSEMIISLSLFFLGHKLQHHLTTESPINMFDRTRTVIFNTLAFTRILESMGYWPTGSRLCTKPTIVIGSNIASIYSNILR
jgi:magnesium-transporting ATPase (P-type)